MTTFCPAKRTQQPSDFKKVIFVFLHSRNAFLHEKGGIALPRAQKTGTTICGAVFDGGVVVGADTRATNGDIVAGNFILF